jgi:hypothetical protein
MVERKDTHVAEKEKRARKRAPMSRNERKGKRWRGGMR